MEKILQTNLIMSYFLSFISDLLIFHPVQILSLLAEDFRTYVFPVYETEQHRYICIEEEKVSAQDGIRTALKMKLINYEIMRSVQKLC
jgi:hypothetical protein